MFALLAQAADGAAPSLFAGQFGMLPLIVIFFAIFYFMIIRPQQKQQKDQKSWLDQLKKGDDVITSGGIVGKIAVVAGDLVTVEIANNVKVRVMKAQITGPFVVKEEKPAPAAEEPAKK